MIVDETAKKVSKMVLRNSPGPYPMEVEIKEDDRELGSSSRGQATEGARCDFSTGSGTGARPVR